MSAAHTPGTWFVGSKFTVGPHSHEDDQTFGMVIPIADVYGPNREEDASLIAAAPDLLAALQQVCLAHKFGERLNKVVVDAIAKATGGAA